MGVVGPFRSSSACGCAAPMQPTARPTGSPDPDRFDIVTVEPLGPWLICTVNYPDCTNHEGRKLLLFYGVTEEGLRRQETLDPHFCDNPEHLSPVARFEPTRRGLALARELAGVGTNAAVWFEQMTDVLAEAVESADRTKWKMEELERTLLRLK